jgi:hypothetical protein
MILKNLDNLIQVIRYGWYSAIYSFNSWSDIMGSNCVVLNWTKEEAEELYRSHFWSSLNEGLDGWLDGSIHDDDDEDYECDLYDLR